MAAKKKRIIRNSASKARKPRKGTRAYAEWERRSLANKKGWETRRRNLRIREHKKKEQLKKELGQLPNLGRMFDEVASFQKENPKNSKEMGMVSAVDLIKTRRDGTIAVNESRARHFGEWTDYMLNRLTEAYDMGAAEFDEMAADLAHDFNLTVREIYTLWYSP